VRGEGEVNSRAKVTDEKGKENLERTREEKRSRPRGKNYLILNLKSKVSN
jgi:hypothetical protein